MTLFKRVHTRLTFGEGDSYDSDNLEEESCAARHYKDLSNPLHLGCLVGVRCVPLRDITIIWGNLGNPGLGAPACLTFVVDDHSAVDDRSLWSKIVVDQAL